jgi:hypothetical protein
MADVQFKPAMIEAIKAGRKMQTRRPVKPGEWLSQPIVFDSSLEVVDRNHRSKWTVGHRYSLCPGRGKPRNSGTSPPEDSIPAHISTRPNDSRPSPQQKETDMPMICHNCGAIYPAAGICPKCFPTAGTKPAAEPTSDIERPTAKRPWHLPDDLERNTPIRGIVEGQDES